MNIVFSAAAVGDLEAVGDYIAQRNPERAGRVVQQIITACHVIADFPFGYPLVPRYESRGLRRKLRGDHLVFYQVETDAIYIVRILNTRQDYERILFPTD
jgi:plasmid stabilization system protein ParE